jgi:hypothetical protein
MAKEQRKTILICSKLPTSLVLNHPLDPTVKVTIRGLNAAPRGKDKQPIYVPYMTTEVDADFWSAWEGAHGEKAKKPFPAIKSGALYAAKSADEANGIAKEREKERTGFEGMSRDADPRMGRGKSEQVFAATD